MYEECGDTDKVIASAHTSPRNFFKYLSLAYMNPQNINDVLSGKTSVSITELFNIATQNQL